MSLARLVEMVNNSLDGISNAITVIDMLTMRFIQVIILKPGIKM